MPIIDDKIFKATGALNDTIWKDKFNEQKYLQSQAEFSAKMMDKYGTVPQLTPEIPKPQSQQIPSKPTPQQIESQVVKPSFRNISPNTIDNIEANRQVQTVSPLSASQQALTRDQQAQYESGGDPTAKNKDSSAFGKYQMTTAAIEDAVKANPKLKDMPYVDNQDAYRDAYRESIRKQLIAKGIGKDFIDDNAINKAWVVGAGGYNALVNADPNATLESVLPRNQLYKKDPLTEQEYKINPNLHNKTVREFLADSNPYSRKDSADLPPSVVLAKEQRVPEPPSVIRDKMILASKTGGPELAEVKARQAGMSSSDNTLRSVEEWAGVPPYQGETEFTQGLKDRVIMTGVKTEDESPLTAAGLAEAEVENAGFANPPPIPNSSYDEVPPALRREEEGMIPPDPSEDKGGDIVPSYNEEDLNAAVESLNSEEKAKHNAVGVAGSKADANGIAAEVANYARERDLKGKSGVAPERKEDLSPTFWEKLSESFGELFTDKEFIKFGILLAGGMLTGGSFGGSLKYAGLYALKSADARQAAEAKAKADLAKEERDAKKELDKEERITQRELDKETIRAGGAAKTARIKSLSDEVKEGIKSGRFSLQNGDKILKVLNSPDGILKAEALLSQEGIESPVYRAGLDSSKPLKVAVEGKLTPVTAYENPQGGYSYVETEVDDKGIQRFFLVNLPRNKATITDKNFDQNQTAAFNELSDKLLSTGVIVRDKNNNTINIDKAVNKDMLVGQLREWSGKQRELGLNDDPRVHIDAINIALRKAIESGDKNPHMGKLLDLALLNTASIMDEDKLTGADSGYIGKAVNDVKMASGFADAKEKSKFIDSLKGSKESKDKKLKAELQRRSSEFFDQVSKGYGDGKDALDQDSLADELKKNAGKNMNRDTYNRIKEAPNKWWAYVYYQIGLKEATQKKE